MLAHQFQGLALRRAQVLTQSINCEPVTYSYVTDCTQSVKTSPLKARVPWFATQDMDVDCGVSALSRASSNASTISLDRAPWLPPQQPAATAEGRAVAGPGSPHKSRLSRLPSAKHT